MAKSITWDGCIDASAAISSFSPKYYKFINSQDNYKKNYLYLFFKRLFDIVFSSLALLFLSPLFLLIAILIKTFSPYGKAIYVQERIGINGNKIRCYKFRSMIPNADKILQQWLAENPEIKRKFDVDFKLKNDPRIIPIIGEFLRKTSLDELPQFYNVLKGDMSIVGPRPIVAEETSKYERHLEKYLCVKPGITGLWQVSGRNDLSYSTRVAIDVYYVHKQNFLMDLEIVIKTVKTMLLREGAY